MNPLKTSGNEVPEKINGIILAGGKSRRMGSDKGLLELRGKKMIQLIIDRLLPVASDILIISSNSDYANLGYPVFPDILTDSGPAAGIYTGLHHSSTEKNIIVGCDTPNLSSGFLRYLASQSEDWDITVPVTRQNIEPLCGIYTKRIGPELFKCIQEGEYKMTAVLQRFRVNYLDITTQKQFNSEHLLRNINTPDDLSKENNFHSS
jgi:molybdopterin-guanine dinucleotide biosynthesis protein A